MTIPTAEQLAAIESRANAATPGPWGFTTHVTHPDEYRDPRTGEIDEGWNILGGGSNPVLDWGYAIVHDGSDEGGIFPEMCDLDFIAHAREDIPLLLAAVRELRECEVRLMELVNAVQSGVGPVRDVTRPDGAGA